jgi:hypothetical protein
LQERFDNKQPLFYEISGPQVSKDRIPLYELIGTLKEYLYIVDRSYLTVTGSKRLSRKERDRYKIVAYNFRPGSLQIDLAIELYELVQQVFPFMMPAGATGLWNIAKQSYDFVKLVTELRFKGEEPVIQEDNSIQAYIVGDNNKIIVNPTLSINADKIEESVTKIAGYINPGAIDHVVLKAPEDDGISITEEEKALFNPDTTISENAETITADIYRLDIESRKGKLHILEGMEPRDIAFQIIGDQSIGPYIDALKIARVQLKALREEAVTLTGKQYLKRLLLTGIPGLAPEQKDLF